MLTEIDSRCRVPSLITLAVTPRSERVDLRHDVAQLVVGVDRDRRGRGAVDDLLRVPPMSASPKCRAIRRSLAEVSVPTSVTVSLPAPPAVSMSSIPSPRSLIRASTPTPVNALMRAMTSPIVIGASFALIQDRRRSVTPLRIRDFEVADVDAGPPLSDESNVASLICCRLSGPLLICRGGRIGHDSQRRRRIVCIAIGHDEIARRGAGRIGQLDAAARTN